MSEYNNFGLNREFTPEEITRLNTDHFNWTRINGAPSNTSIWIRDWVRKNLIELEFDDDGRWENVDA